MRIAEPCPAGTKIIAPQARPVIIRPDTNRMRKDVEELVRFLRNPEHLSELNESSEYILQEFQKAGFVLGKNLFVDKFYDKYIGEGVEFKNIRVTLGPQNGERFIIGAHYDVYGDQPGADDNATGVAGLLEIARMLIENKVQLKGPLDLVAYSLEEKPYGIDKNGARGSEFHVKRLKAQGIKVKGMLSLEMIGYFSDEAGSQDYPLKPLRLMYPDKGNFIALVGYGNSLGLIRRTCDAIRRHTPMPVNGLWVPWKSLAPDVARSDHDPFSLEDCPAAMVTDTANLRSTGKLKNKAIS